MELSEITIMAGNGGSVVAELRADATWGDRGYWITVSGWGGTEDEARAQIDAALTALDLDIEKIGNAL
jgi:hypothetical protein